MAGAKLLFLRVTPNEWILQRYSMEAQRAQCGYVSVVRKRGALSCTCTSFATKALCQRGAGGASCVHTEIVTDHEDKATPYSHQSVGRDRALACVLPLVDYDWKVASRLGFSHRKPKLVPYAVRPLQADGLSIVTVQAPKSGGQQTMRCTTHPRGFCQCTAAFSKSLTFGAMQPIARRPNTARPSPMRLETLPFRAIKQQDNRECQYLLL